MKNLRIAIVLTLLLSCDNNKKYQGKWSNSMLKYSYHNETKNLIIENDSITFSYPYFEFSNKYPLTIEKRTLKFNGLSLKALVEKDTLSLNDSIYFVRDKADTLSGFETKLSIKLPSLDNIKNKFKQKNRPTIYINYGQRLDNAEFSLQLNDRLTSISDLSSFISYDSHHQYPILVLFIDKNTPLKVLEEMFYEFITANSLNLAFVDNINLNTNYNSYLYYEYETLEKKLLPIAFNESYIETEFNNSKTPPPLPYTFLLFETMLNNESNYLLLIKNEVYFNNQITDSSELHKYIEEIIYKNQVLISLFDLESNYSSFLKMNAIIDSTYHKIREEKSQLKYQKSLSDLSRDELDSIKKMVPKKHIWNYSIPHFNTIIENNNTFYGLKVKPVDTLKLNKAIDFNL